MKTTTLLTAFSILLLAPACVADRFNDACPDGTTPEGKDCVRVVTGGAAGMSAGAGGGSSGKGAAGGGGGAAGTGGASAGTAGVGAGGLAGSAGKSGASGKGVGGAGAAGGVGGTGGQAGTAGTGAAGAGNGGTSSTSAGSGGLGQGAAGLGGSNAGSSGGGAPGGSGASAGAAGTGTGGGGLSGFAGATGAGGGAGSGGFGAAGSGGAAVMACAFTGLAHKVIVDLSAEPDGQRLLFDNPSLQSHAKVTRVFQSRLGSALFYTFPDNPDSGVAPATGTLPDEETLAVATVPGGSALLARKPNAPGGDEIALEMLDDADLTGSSAARSVVTNLPAGHTAASGLIVPDGMGGYVSLVGTTAPTNGVLVYAHWAGAPVSPVTIAEGGVSQLPTALLRVGTTSYAFGSDDSGASSGYSLLDGSLGPFPARSLGSSLVLLGGADPFSALALEFGSPVQLRSGTVSEAQLVTFLPADLGIVSTLTSPAMLPLGGFPRWNLGSVPLFGVVGAAADTFRIMVMSDQGVIAASDLGKPAGKFNGGAALVVAKNFMGLEIQVVWRETFKPGTGMPYEVLFYDRISCK